MSDKTKDFSKASDGFHTFGELYEHRHALYLSLMRCWKHMAWASRVHSDGAPSYTGWFLAGIQLPVGQISYHLPNKFLPTIRAMGIQVLPIAPPWDGHTADDVVERLMEWLTYKPQPPNR